MQVIKLTINKNNYLVQQCRFRQGFFNNSSLIILTECNYQSLQLTAINEKLCLIFLPIPVEDSIDFNVLKIAKLQSVPNKLAEMFGQL
jgi:hypothetical protein